MDQPETEGSTGLLAGESVSPPKDLHVLANAAVSSSSPMPVATATQWDAEANVPLSLPVDSGLTTTVPSEGLSKQETEGLTGLLSGESKSASSFEELPVPTKATESSPSPLPSATPSDPPQANVLEPPMIDSSPTTAVPSEVLPKQGTLLDHTCFPHIMDMIIASAPRESLLRLSLTSKNMWSRTNPFLPTHIRLSAPPSNASGEVHVDRLMTKLGSGSEENSAFDCPISAVEPVLAPWSFSATRILDLVRIQQLDEIPELVDGLTQVHTVRCSKVANSPSSISAKRIVFEDIWCDPQASSHAVAPAWFPCGLEKIVYNMRCALKSGMTKIRLPYFNFPFPKTVRDLVVIFNNVDYDEEALLSSRHSVDATTSANNASEPSSTGATSPEDLLEATDPPRVSLGWLDALPHEFPGNVTFTFVDATLIPPIYFGLPGPTLSCSKLKEGIVNQLIKCCGARCRHLWERDEVNAAKKAIRVITKDAYRAEIGEMDYHLETEFAWP